MNFSQPFSLSAITLASILIHPFAIPVGQNASSGEEVPTKSTRSFHPLHQPVRGNKQGWITPILKNKGPSGPCVDGFSVFSYSLQIQVSKWPVSSLPTPAISCKFVLWTPAQLFLIDELSNHIYVKNLQMNVSNFFFNMRYLESICCEESVTSV